MILTGFEGYGGRGLNPAEEVIRALDGETVAGAHVSGRILPVTYRGLRRRLHEIVHDERPEALIALGLWPGEPMVRLERFAVNFNDFEIPDNEQNQEHGPVSQDGGLALASTLPVEKIQERLLSADVPARLSSSAGTFLCNATMYCALEAAREARLDVPCGFVHLPYLPAQVAEIILSLQASHAMELHQRADLASMPLDLMIKAVRIVIEAALEYTR